MAIVVSASAAYSGFMVGETGTNLDSQIFNFDIELGTAMKKADK